VPNVCKVEFLWTQNGIPAANVRYLLYSGGPPAAGDCAAIAHDISSPFISGMMPGYPASTIFEACRVMDLASATGAEGTYTAAAPGTDSAEALPANCAILVNQTIARRYRGGHPRQYYPAPSIDSMATPSSWNSSLVANVGAAEAAFAAACTGPSYGSTDLIYVVNVSYVSGGAPRVVPVVDQITGHVVSGIVRTQRRRVTASSY
jgi:hypothetical protein